MRERIYEWLQGCPAAAGETVNADFVPAWGGWSFSLTESRELQDILGTGRKAALLRLSRRCSVTENGERLAAMRSLEEAVLWARRNPPEGLRVGGGGEPELSARDPAGTEDFTVTMTVREE